MRFHLLVCCGCRYHGIRYLVAQVPATTAGRTAARPPHARRGQLLHQLLGRARAGAQLLVTLLAHRDLVVDAPPQLRLAAAHRQLPLLRVCACASQLCVCVVRSAECACMCARTLCMRAAGASAHAQHLACTVVVKARNRSGVAAPRRSSACAHARVLHDG